jgi:DNA polymerase-3 subunit gamma/tau
MSYQVLARKWRPKSFAEMAGQEHVLQALINALDDDRLHHAYLFSGTRGVGKTTIGRILSKCLNCESGISSVPCGKCTSCQEIDSGRFIDLIEVDAASRTGVDDMRDLLDNVQYLPSRGRFKVYLIDEVHMLSKQSFAALLKTLEEPPPHVKFLFATTDPQKLPITVLSRCLQFNLKNLSPERIYEYLKFVLGEENVAFEDGGLWALGRAADGSMRDALSLTDQAIAHGGGLISEADVTAMLGSIEKRFIINVCNAVASNVGQNLFDSINLMADHSPDYDAALSDVLSIWHQVAIMQTVPDAIDPALGYHKEIVELARDVSREDVQLFYQICLLGRKDLPLAPDQRSGFEMVMLRSMAFRPKMDGRRAPSSTFPKGVEQPAKKSEPELHSELKLDSGASPLSLKLKDSHSHSIPVDCDNQLEQKLKNLDIELLAEESSNQFTAENASDELINDSSEMLADTKFKKSVDEASVDKVSLEKFAPSNWTTVRRQLQIGASLGEIASHCLFQGRDGKELSFLLDQDENSLFDSSHNESLGFELSNYFGESLTVSIDSGRAVEETPRAARLRSDSERHAAAVHSLNADPAVEQFKKVFDGSLDEQSVEAID